MEQGRVMIVRQKRNEIRIECRESELGVVTIYKYLENFLTDNGENRTRIGKESQK